MLSVATAALLAGFAACSGSSGTTATRAAANASTTTTGCTTPSGFCWAYATGRPTGATARCKDNTYSYEVDRSVACIHDGGVGWFYTPPTGPPQS
jgi:hypothetical protein